MEDAEDLQAQQTAITHLIKIRGTNVLKTPSLAKSIMADLTRNKQKGAVPAFYTMLDEMNSGKSFSDEKAAQKFLPMIENACRENGLEIPYEIIVVKEKIKVIAPEDDTVTENDFRMTVQDCFTISGRGIVVTGIVEQGSIKMGDDVEIRGKGQTQYSTIAGIESYNKLIDIANKGDWVGILFSERGIIRKKTSSVSIGDCLYKKESV